VLWYRESIITLSILATTLGAVTVALIADDMGLGKTHCALPTLLYLKHILDEAAAGRPLACVGGEIG